MNMQLLQFVGGIVASGAFGAIVVALFNRGKTKAETEQIAANVYKGLNADLLAQLKEARIDAVALHTEILQLTERLEKMEEKDEEKERELKLKNERIVQLERRVDELESELKKYRSIDESIDLVKDTLHAKLDETAEKIKTDIKQ